MKTLGRLSARSKSTTSKGEPCSGVCFVSNGVFVHFLRHWPLFYLLACHFPQTTNPRCANSHLDVKNKTTRVEGVVLYRTSEWRASNKQRESLSLKSFPSGSPGSAGRITRRPYVLDTSALRPPPIAFARSPHLWYRYAPGPVFNHALRGAQRGMIHAHASWGLRLLALLDDFVFAINEVRVWAERT